MIMSGYYICAVRNCKNNNLNFPNKLFFHAPINKDARNTWLIAIGKTSGDYSDKSRFYVCEDHFDLPNDMANYWQYKLMQHNPPQRKLLKAGVLPHKFTINQGPIISSASFSQDLDETGVLKKQRLDEHDALEIQNQPPEFMSLTKPSTSEHADVFYVQLLTQVESKEVATQANIKPKYRSKETQYRYEPVVDEVTAPIKVQISPTKSSATSTTTSEEDFVNPSEPSSGEAEYVKIVDKERLSENAWLATKTLVYQNARFYLGIPNEYMFIVEKLSVDAKIELKYILLTLEKIRLDKTFFELGHKYGISTSTASKQFTTVVPIAAHHLKSFIFWTSKTIQRKMLPISFRTRYYNVESIIDALEIEIEKPSNPIHQALSWSEYKKCNTLKYLISSSPDGVINFISKGYAGHISDTALTGMCGYLDIIPEGAYVMADRGFKQLEPLLIQKGAKLIRPPSVSSSAKLSKAEVLESKRIASLRIHIERNIRRIQEYKFLHPHACINNKLISLVDHAIIIAAALINLQDPLIN